MAEALDLAPRPLAAFEIGCLARQALQPGQWGQVCAVFERSIYVSLAETEVCVGPPGLGAGPLNLRCHATPEDWRAAGLREGMAVLVGSRDLRLPPYLAISVADAAVWTPEPPGQPPSRSDSSQKDTFHPRVRGRFRLTAAQPYCPMLGW